MATLQQTKVVDIDTQGAVKSLSDLRKQINEAKNALFEMAEGTEEYNNKMRELGAAQDELSSFMAKTRQGCSALEGSYAALSYQMSQLKQEYKNTADEARRNELAPQINAINEQLKEMDAAVGVFSRNVGNYTGAMSEVFNKLGITTANLGPLFNTLANSAAEAGSKGQTAFQGLSAGAKNLGTQLKALAANPVGAVIMAIVVAVKALKAGFDAVKASVARNEEAQNNLHKAMAPIKGVIDGIRNAFDGLVEVLTKVGSVIGNTISGMMEFLGIASETVQLENDIADMQASNAEQHRKFLVENAQLELDASEARAKAAEKDKYSAEERIALIKEYAAKQQEIAANNLKEAQDELKLLELQAATGKNNAEMNDKLAAAQAKVLQVQTAYNNTLRETNKQISTLNNQISSETAAAQKKAADAAKQHANELANLRKQYQQIMTQLSDELLTNDYDKQRAQAKRAFDEQEKQFKEQLQKRAITRSEYDKAMVNAEIVLNRQLNDIAKNEAKDLENFYNDINQPFNSEAANKVIAEEKKTLDQLDKLMNLFVSGQIKTQEEYNTAYEKIVKAGAERANQVRDEEYTKQAQNERNKTVENTTALTDLELALLDKRYKEGNLKTIDYIKQNYDLKIKENEQLIAAEQQYRNELDTMLENSKISREAYNQAIIESDNRLTQLQIANIELVKEEQDLLIDNQITALTSLTDTMTEFASNIASIGDGISSKWSNVFGNVGNLVNDVGTALKSNEKGFKKWSQVAAQSCMVVSSMFSALADEQDENSKEGFEAAKKMRYAEALFSTLSGIISVWPAAMELGPIAGPIAGAALTAMISGIGAAQIAKISKTQFGDMEGSAASPSASGVATAIQAPVQYQTNVIPESQEGQTDTKVYVLESDIQETGNRVRVAENEARY